MKTNLRILKVATLSVLLSACHNKQKKPVSTVPEKTATTKSEVTVTEMEPDDEFYKAVESFVKGENQNSANFIKEAAKSMRSISVSASPKRKVRIESAAAGLEAFAKKVEDGKVKDITQLYAYFGRSARSLAGHRLDITEHEYFVHTEGKAGISLQTAIEQLEKSVSTHHRALKPNEKQVLDDALDVATRLQKGDKVDEEELSGAIQSVNNQIENWNKEFELKS